MKLPDEITIFSITYPITYVDHDIDVDLDRQVVGRPAQLSYRTPSIRILKKDRGKERPAEIIWQNIIHELVHLILYNQGLDQRFTAEGEEELVQAVACGLNDFLWRNIFTPMKGNKTKETKNVN